MESKEATQRESEPNCAPLSSHATYQFGRSTDSHATSLPTTSGACVFAHFRRTIAQSLQTCVPMLWSEYSLAVCMAALCRWHHFDYLCARLVNRKTLRELRRSYHLRRSSRTHPTTSECAPKELAENRKLRAHTHTKA